VKLLYYMAVCKPRKSKVYLPVFRGANVIISRYSTTAKAKGEFYLLNNIGPSNRFQDPADWIVKAARVMV